MNVITLAHQKGGVGKTTLCVNLASAIAGATDKRVGLVDTDPQGSIASVAKMIKGIKVIPFNHSDPVESMAGLRKEDLDVLIIDTPPYLSSALTGIFNMSDVVIVPTKMGLWDILAIRATADLIKKAQAKKYFHAAILRNMVRVPNETKIAREVDEMLKEVGLPVLKAKVAERTSYVSSSYKGVFNSDDEKAQKEVITLLKEILKLATSEKNTH